MYEQFYQLQRRPFPATPDLSCFFACETVNAPLDQLRLCVEHGQGIGVLTAPAGAGKTLLCHRMLAELGDRFIKVFLGNAGFPTSRSLLQAILLELGVTEANGEEQELRHQLRETVLHVQPDHEAVVVVIDEAHEFPVELLDEVRLLTDIANAGRSLVRVVLSGQLELEERMTDRSFNAINQRIGSHVFLQPFSNQESTDYLRFRLETAGGDPAQIITDDSMALIVRASGGVPRCLNQLADHSLLLSFAADQSPVQTDTVREALDDLKQLPLHWNDIADGISATGYEDATAQLPDEAVESETVESEPIQLSDDFTAAGSDESNSTGEGEESDSDETVFEFGAEEVGDPSCEDDHEAASVPAAEASPLAHESGVSGLVFDITADACGVGEVCDGLVDLGAKADPSAADGPVDETAASEGNQPSSIPVECSIEFGSPVQDAVEACSDNGTHDNGMHDNGMQSETTDVDSIEPEMDASNNEQAKEPASPESVAPASSIDFSSFVEDSMNEIQEVREEILENSNGAADAEAKVVSESEDSQNAVAATSSGRGHVRQEVLVDPTLSEDHSGIVWNLALAGSHADSRIPIVTGSASLDADAEVESDTDSGLQSDSESTAVTESDSVAGQQSVDEVDPGSPGPDDTAIEDSEPVFSIEFGPEDVENGPDSPEGAVPQQTDVAEESAAVESVVIESIAIHESVGNDSPSSDQTTNHPIEASVPDEPVRDSRPDSMIDAIVPMIGEIEESAADTVDELPDRTSFAIESDLVDSVSHSDPEIEDEIGAAMLDLCLDTQWSIQESEQRMLEKPEEVEPEAEFLDEDADEFTAYDVVQPEDEDFSFPPSAFESESQPAFNEPIPQQPLNSGSTDSEQRPYGRLFSDLRRRQQAGE